MAPEERESCLDRAAGNPLHLQALLESRDSVGSVPPRLADLFLVHLARLSPEVADLVRAASVVGTRFDLDLVAAAACTSPDRTVGLLREARDHRLVVERDDGLEFRHALVRDALYGDLLPTERRVVHRRIAQELARRADATGEGADSTLLGPLTHHAAKAGDTATALAASARAGMRWRRDGTDALQHLRRAEELWSVVPEASHVEGISLTDIREETAMLLWLTGDPDAARRVLRDALASAESAGDPRDLSRLYAAYGLVGRAGPEDELWEVALSRCLELAGPSPSAERAQAHHVKGLAAVFQRGRVAEGRRHFETAHAEAAASGARRTEAATLWFLGATEAESGDPTHGVVTLRRAVTALDEAHDRHQSLLARGDLVWMMAGWTTDPGTLGEARATVTAAREAGMARPLLHALSHLTLVRVWRGELDEAERCLAEMRSLGVPNEEWHVTAAHLLIARGRLAEGERALRTSEEIDQDDRMPDEDTSALWVELLLARDQADAACGYLRSYVAALGDTDSVERLSVTAAYGHLALRAAAHGPGRRTDVDDLEAAADRALGRLLDGGAGAWPASRFRSRVLVAEACAAARAGERRPELWEAATQGLEAGGYRLLALRLRPWLVEDLWAAGRRDEARIVAQRAWDEARAMGAGAVAEQVRRVAVARRMALPEQRLDLVRAKLTPREREVLDLLEAGATNRDIAGSLVISEKTAGVHVSHVLAKLGAARRGEAVAMARRAAAAVED
jgi:DNA-binding CsgD family transcriptional regulator